MSAFFQRIDFFITIEVFFFQILVGILPIFLFLQKTFLPLSKRLLLSIGLSYILIGLCQFLFVLINLNSNYLIYFIFLLINSALIWRNIKKKNDIAAKTNDMPVIYLFAALIIGYFLYYIHFGAYANNSFFHKDILFNTAIAAQLKKNYPIYHTYWYTQKVYHYHYFTHLYIAAFSKFLNIELIDLIKIYIPLNIYTSLSFIFFCFFQKRNSILFFIVALLFSVSFFNESWIATKIFTSHISALRANSFFWGLPIFISGVYLWILYDKERNNFNKYEIARYLRLLLLVFFMAFCMGFTKGIFLFSFFFFEFLSFLKNINYKIFNAKYLSREKKTIISYLIIPLVMVLLKLIFAGSETLSFFKLNDVDLYNFSYQSYLLAFIVTLAIPLALIIISKTKDEYTYFLFAASFLNILLYFISDHPGNSDIYFIFSAIILNLLIILFLKMENKILYLFSGMVIFFLFSFFLKGSTGNSYLFMNHYNNIKQLQRFQLKTENMTPEDIRAYGIKGAADLMNLKNKLNNKSVVMLPMPSCQNFYFSVFLETHIWAECHTYGNFLQNWITENTEKYSHLENPKIRYDLQKKFAYDKSLTKNECDTFFTNSGITHVLIENKDLNQISQCLKDKNRFSEKNFTLFVLE